MIEIQTNVNHLITSTRYYFNVLMIFLLLIIIVIHLGEAKTITVDDDSDHADYHVIQHAINNASENDTISVWEGTYFENVVVNKTVKLIGNGSHLTTIDGRGHGIVVRVTARMSNITGFSIIGGGNSTWPADKEAAGIKIEADQVVISRNNCSNNFRNGIILYNSSNHTVFDNIIESNLYYGVKMVGTNNNMVANNTVRWNGRDGFNSRTSNYNNFTHNTISENYDGICIIGPSEGIILHYNSITLNSKRGIAVGTEKGEINNNYEIDASLNYWGSDLGPQHHQENPNGLGDVVTDNVIFKPWLNDDGSINQSSYDSIGNEEDSTAFTPQTAIIGVMTIASISIVWLIFFREDIKYGLFTILFSPLYTKLEKDKVLSQSNRNEIYSYLTRNPGANFTRIKDELNLGTGTLVHHLHVLEKQGFINSRKSESRKVFFLPHRSNQKTRVQHAFPPVQKRILEYLYKTSSASMRDIEIALSLPQTTVNYNIRKLLGKGLVRQLKGKRNGKFILSDDAVNMM